MLDTRVCGKALLLPGLFKSFDRFLIGEELLRLGGGTGPLLAQDDLEPLNEVLQLL